EEGTANSPPTTDANGDTIPDWVETTRDTFEHVWSIEVGQYGYRPPKPDPGPPDTPDSRLDVFLTDTGGAAVPFYGACGITDPNFENPGYQFSDFAAACQVDNDFDPSQFPAPGANGLAALQVTAAHEFFHAIQFGYDAFEDLWLLEGTAVWMEDQLYDDVNDNYQYLASSAIVAPFAPLDFSGTEFGFEYASWLFWRFLSEHFGTSGVDPSVIKRVWDLADGSAVGPDQYSLQAVQTVVGDLGSSFGDFFADFAVANYLPELFYEEGRAYVDAVGFVPEDSFKISTSKRKAGGTVPLDHLTSYYASFAPGKGVLGTAKLKLVLDLPASITAPQATALVVFKTGVVQEVPLALDASGAATRKVTFNKKKVAGIVLVLSNASTRFSCGRGTAYSCSGAPMDDDLSYKLTAKLIQ
ncbi:MAG: MXAN_6640 family putative metalloprotease, partial [Actinomycetota bacterium]